MRNEMIIKFSTIELKLPFAADWDTAKRMTGKIKEISPGVFEMALSTHNLQRVFKYFNGPKKPVVISGHGLLDNLKKKLDDYKSAREKLKDIFSRERYPVEPNGLFIPYAHQTLIIGAALEYPFLGIFADCGTGKTGTVARLIEIVIGKGELSPGKILVSAPLSILDTSWADDIQKFTRLRYARLWTSDQNDDILGEDRILLADYGLRPPNSISTRRREGIWFKHPISGEARRKKPTSLDGKGWVKYHANWKESVDLTGEASPFGQVIGRTHAKDNTREKFILEQLARTDVDVFLINHDGVRVYQEILKKHGFECVVIDESTKIKTPEAEVSHAHIDISWKCKRRHVMTGTPNPNGFEDLWNQYYFLDRGMTLEPALRDYLTEYFNAIATGLTVSTKSGMKSIVKYKLKNEETKKRLIERVKSVGIFIDQRECLDLPARTDLRREIQMLPEQERAYREMERTLITTLEDEVTKDMVESEALNALSKIMRLRQITSGFLANREGDLVSLTKNPKLQDLDEVVDELGDKKIVTVAQFREEIRLVLERYKHLGACAVYGDVSEGERTANIRKFQNDPETRVIVLQPAAAAHGITLTAAHYLMFLSLSYNYEHYYQTGKRIERIGQKEKMFVLHSLARFKNGGETIDDILFDVLKGKDQNRSVLYSEDPAELAMELLDRMRKQVESRHE